MFVLFIEFEKENKDHIVKMNNILQCLFNNEIADNLKVNFIIYTMKSFLKNSAHAYFERPCFFCKFFGGKLGLRTRKT